MSGELLTAIRAAALAAGLLSSLSQAHSNEEVATHLQVTLKGLEHTGEILIDAWGVPHIYAETISDAFFLQGFNAARDRLWQIDTWRRRGLGKLSAVLGPQYLRHDEAARLFLYRGDMGSEWEAYGNDAKTLVAAFANGINAFIQLTGEQPELLPPEFTQLGYEPELWVPEDVVRIRSHTLTGNVEQEVQRARTLCERGFRAERLRRHLQPAHVPGIPEGLDVCAIPMDVLGLYHYARGHLQSLHPPGITSAPIAGSEGSNNWAISAARSATGRAVLASDPHRLHEIPSGRYIAHLSAPGLDVIGAGEPFAPGISIGHNGSIAYGFTVFFHDQEDLYVYELNPDDTEQYRYRGAWESFRVIRENVAVTGEDARNIKLRFSRHGPVVYLDQDSNRAFAVRSATLEPGTSPYLASLGLMQAHNWANFRKAMGNWRMPGQNMVYADAGGDIGWIVGGLVPQRSNWDGLLPVPGNGQYEWDGLRTTHERLQRHRPGEGWIASANQMNIPMDCPATECRSGFEWADPLRYQRIADVLGREMNPGLEISLNLQTDRTSLRARKLVDLLATVDSQRVPSADSRFAMARSLLTAWDGRLHPESSAAALFEIWTVRHLGPQLYEGITDHKLDGLLPMMPDPLAVDDILSRSEFLDSRLQPASRKVILVDSLQAAYDDTVRLLGPDPDNWAWGKLLHLKLEPLLGTEPPETPQGSVDCAVLAGVPLGGNMHTPDLAIYLPESFRAIAGPSFRMVVDVGNWSNSRAVNMPGQSGDPRSPHYCDLYSLWAAGEYFPLLYDRESIQAQTRQHLKLTPRH